MGKSSDLSRSPCSCIIRLASVQIFSKKIQLHFTNTSLLGPLVKRRGNRLAFSFFSLHPYKNRIILDILDLPLRVTFYRLYTIYNFRAARNASCLKHFICGAAGSEYCNYPPCPCSIFFRRLVRDYHTESFFSSFISAVFLPHSFGIFCDCRSFP